MKRVCSFIFFMVVFALKLHAQISFTYTPSQLAQIKNLKAKVEASPTNLKAHQEYISFFYKNGSNKINNPLFEDQYKTWMKKFPKNDIVPFAAGKAYMQERSPKAASFLLQASILKPDNAETWYLLSQNASYTINTIANRII